MSKKRNSGTVSGEIMPDGRGATSRPRGAQAVDIVDAEYETVGAQTSPGQDSERRRPAADDSASGFDMLKPGSATASKGGSGRGGPVFWGFGLVAVLLAFWVSGGYALLGDGPFMGAAEPKSGPALKIASLTSRVETRGGRSVLLVDGEAVNGGAGVRTLPKLSIDVLDKNGATTRYFLGTNSPALAPGEKFTFSSRLVAPKDGVKSVSVTIGENED